MPNLTRIRSALQVHGGHKHWKIPASLYELESLVADLCAVAAYDGFKPEEVLRLGLGLYQAEQERAQREPEDDAFQAQAEWR